MARSTMQLTVAEFVRIPVKLGVTRNFHDFRYELCRVVQTRAIDDKSDSIEIVIANLLAETDILEA